MLWLSFFTNEILSLPPEGYSLRWYRAIAGQRQFISGFQLSATVALAATAAGLVVTLPAAFALTRSQLPGREAILHALNDFLDGSSIWLVIIVQGASLLLFLGYTMSAASIERQVRETPMFRGESLIMDAVSEPGEP